MRECAELLKHAGFTPIIEPVKESLKGLERALNAVVEVDGEAIIVVNPDYGDHAENSEALKTLVQTDFGGKPQISAGILLTDQTAVNDAVTMCNEHQGKTVTLIHAGFTEAGALAESLAMFNIDVQHAFFEDHCGKLYQKHFRDSQRVLLRDGFQSRANRKHPPVEFFSDLHETFRDEGMQGFGDFLIVGDQFSESGGPAYAVAIHLTFIDPDKDKEMHIHHFISDRTATPTDPGGKFAEALQKLVGEVNRPGTHIKRTGAVDEFLRLHERGHYPGLGYVKKLSMQHHIETLAKHFQE